MEGQSQDFNVEAIEQQQKDKRVEEILLNLPDGAFSPQSKGDIFLVHLGVKPATFQLVDSYSEYDPAYAKKHYAVTVGETEHALKEMDFPFYEVPGKENTKFFIGRSLEDATALFDAYSLPYDKDYDFHRKRGRALGYPDTAVEAFIKYQQGDTNAALDAKNIPQLEGNDIVKFIGFRLSSDQWREEVAEIQKQVAMLKEHAPQLYQQILKAT